MGRTSFLKKIREKVEELRDDPTYLTEEVCQMHVNWLKEFIDKHYRRPAHVYCVTKKLLKKHFQPDHILHKVAYNILHESVQERATSEKKAQVALEKRNEDVTFFTEKQITDVMDYARALSHPIVDARWSLNLPREDFEDAEAAAATLFVCLQLAIGCRQRDLFDVDGVTWKEDKKSIAHVWQYGGSKTRGKKKNVRKRLVYFTAPVFFSVLKKFQSVIAQDTRPLDEKISHWNRPLCELTRRYFPVKQERSGTHVNRALYAAMLRYQNKQGFLGSSSVRATQKALGHDKMTSSLHYLYVDIKD